MISQVQVRMLQLLWGIGVVLCLALPAAAQEDLEVTLIPDAWPSRKRTIAYEYNQKNHNAPPSFIDRKKDDRAPEPVAWEGERYRLIGVRMKNNLPDERGVRLRFEAGGKKTKKIPATLEAEQYHTRYFPIREPEDLRVGVEILGKSDEVLYSGVIELPKNGHATRSPSEADGVARELNREDLERRSFATRTARVRVVDDLMLPVENTRLLLLLEDGLMAYQGRTDADGVWSGEVIPGAYEVYALAEVPDRTDRDASTAVIQLPRLLAIKSRLSADERSLELTPTRTISVAATDVDERPLSLSRTWITPTELAPAFRYALVTREARTSARLDSKRDVAGGRFLLLTSPELALEMAVLAQPWPGHSVFLTQSLPSDAVAGQVVFDPSQLGRLLLDPGTGAGPAQRAVATVAAVGAVREQFQVEARELHTLHVTPGEYRCDLTYQFHSGQYAEFAPLRVPVAAEQVTDLTPRPPFRTTLYYKPKPDQKKVQFWVAVEDSSGRLLRRVRQGAILTGEHKGRQALNQQLNHLRWERQQKTDNIDPGHLSYELRMPFGDDVISTRPQAELLRAFNVEGASAFAPAALEDEVMALLPEVKRSVDGSLEFLGLPEGGRQIHMEFDIFLPPGIGGTGGGGRITLDAQVLLPFSHGTDLLPGAFRHELGHCLGFGHDPYMMLAPCGVDEERFSSFGYRMLQAEAFQQTFRYLEGSRHEETTPWAPGRGAFAALRLLYGPDVHVKMLDQRRISEQTLNLHGLSSIERIATLYSLALDRNVAWVFRAHGWPVFDARVDLGGSAVRSQKKHPRQLNYATIDGSPINAWWMFGPNDREEGPGWRAVQWPNRFTSVDADAAPSNDVRRYLFFRRFHVQRDTEAQVLCSSDVQLELRVNGTAIGFLDSSPQFRQPRHDELMLNQKRSFTVPLYKGENQLEVAVVQYPGSKGFFLEWITPDGKPLPMKVINDGPPGVKATGKPQRLAARNPIYNGSFEQGGSFPTAWVEGPTEPPRALQMELIEGGAVHGRRHLRITLARPGRGAVIQRFVTEPGKKYRLQAALRTSRFRGEAYVAFFTDDLHDGQRGKTKPLKLAQSKWQSFEADWFAGTGRVTYVACYVKGTSGQVDFDALELVEVR